jgi:hypothetical protein
MVSATYAVTKYDPTRTLLLRNNFARALANRYKSLTFLVHQAIVKNDAFGFNEGFQAVMDVTAPGHHAFDFPQSADSITAFMGWFDQQVAINLNGALITQYIEVFYQRGVARGRQELRNAGYRVPTVEETGGLLIVCEQPTHFERSGMVRAQASNELDGVLATLRQRISRQLLQGMFSATNAIELHKLLVPVFKGIAYRIEVMARTEAIRAHHLAIIQEYRNWNSTTVYVRTEQSTDNNKCGCEELQDKSFTLDEIENMIPMHPLCHCLAIPMDARLGR